MVIIQLLQFKMTKMKHAWFPVTLSFVLTHLSDKSALVSQICLTSAWGRNSELLGIMRVSFFSHFELYFALHSCVLSTFKQHLLQFPTIIQLLLIMIIY